VERLKDSDPCVREKVEGIRGYAETNGVPQSALLRMAKLGAVLGEWMAENGIQATAMQCWSSMQRNLGVNCCTIMSMMSENLMPSACEVDVTGAVTMYALQLASGRPSA